MRVSSSFLSVLSAFAFYNVLITNATILCDGPSTLTCETFPSCCDDLEPRDSFTSSAVTTSCTNALRNPSFGSGLEPWSSFATGSWAARDVIVGAAHHGTHFYYGLSNSTNASTITLSQMEINVAAGAKAECSAWVYAGGDLGEKGTVGFEVFLDGASCGQIELKEGDRGKGWVKVGQEMQINGDAHMLAVVVTTDAKGGMGAGIEIGVDDLRVGGC